MLEGNELEKREKKRYKEFYFIWMANVKNWKNGSPRKLREVADRSSRLRGKRGVEKVEDRQPLNLTWILRSGRKNDRVVEAEKGEKERGDGGNYFRFRALGIGYTFSPLGVCLGEIVVVAASFLLAEDGQPVVTWLFHKVKAEPSMTPVLAPSSRSIAFLDDFRPPFDRLQRFGKGGKHPIPDLSFGQSGRDFLFFLSFFHFSFSPPRGGAKYVGRGSSRHLIRGFFSFLLSVRVNVQLLRYGASSDYTVRRVKSGMECSIVLYCFVEWYCGKEETSSGAALPFVISRRK